MGIDVERQPGSRLRGLSGEGLPINEVFIEIPELSATRN
jgi:hypothetical protein